MSVLGSDKSGIALTADMPGKPSLALMDFRLRENNNGEETVTTLEPGPDYLNVIETKFGILIDALYEEFRPLGHQPMEHSLDFLTPDD